MSLLGLFKSAELRQSQSDVKMGSGDIRSKLHRLAVAFQRLGSPALTHPQRPQIDRRDVRVRPDLLGAPVHGGRRVRVA